MVVLKKEYLNATITISCKIKTNDIAMQILSMYQSRGVTEILSSCWLVRVSLFIDLGFP